MPPKTPSIPSHPSRHVYDVIILGGQLGGALSAALLAKRGYRVLLVDHDGAGSSYEHAGYLLPYAPAPPLHLRGMPALEETLNELGLTSTVQRTLKEASPELQLILPRNRPTLYPDEGRRLAELKREFGNAGPTVNAAVKALATCHEHSDPLLKEPLDLPPDGALAAWRLRRVLKRHPAALAALQVDSSDPVARLLLQLRLFSGYMAEPSLPLAASRSLSLALACSGHYPGGREGLRELFRRRLVELGGDALGCDAQAHVAEALVFEGQRVVGVKLLQSEMVYRASALVAATDAASLRRLVHDKKHHRRLLEVLDLPETRRFLFTLNWVVKADALPCGMGSLLLVDSQSELGALLIQVLPACRPADQPADEQFRVVCAGAFVPETARNMGEPHFKALADQLATHLDKLMPFTRGHLLLASIPYLHAEPIRGNWVVPHPLSQIEAKQLLGVEGLHQRTPIKNLILASREVLPGLGVEGELLAGIRAARLVHESLHKRDPRKR